MNSQNQFKLSRQNKNAKWQTYQRLKPDKQQFFMFADQLKKEQKLREFIRQNLLLLEKNKSFYLYKKCFSIASIISQKIKPNHVISTVLIQKKVFNLIYLEPNQIFQELRGTKKKRFNCMKQIFETLIQSSNVTTLQKKAIYQLNCSNFGLQQAPAIFKSITIKKFTQSLNKTHKFQQQNQELQGEVRKMKELQSQLLDRIQQRDYIIENLIKALQKNQQASLPESVQQVRCCICTSMKSF